MPAPDPLPPDTVDDAGTGLPGLRRWRSVYVVVLAVVATWVALLTWLTGAYS